MSTLPILTLLFFVVMTGFYSGLDSAFATANRLHFELQKKQGLKSGRVLSGFFEQPYRFLGITLTGYHLFLVLLVLEAHAVWELFYAPPHTGGIRATVIPELLLTLFLAIVPGEFLPKVLFGAKADRILQLSVRSGLMGTSQRILWPIARMVSWSAIRILDLFFNVRIDRKKVPFSKTDMEQLFEQASMNETTPRPDTALIEAALSLPEVRVRECLIPRKEVEAIELHTDISEARKKFISTRLSKLVVYDTNIDHIAGYIHQLDLFRDPENIKQILLPIPAVPESMSASDLIGRFTKEHKSIAWVVDEFGGTAGIVTMEDLLEELFGEIRDEFDVEELEERQLGESEFLFSGRLELDYLNQKYGLQLPENTSETLSGYIIHEQEMIPRHKERIVLGKYEFEILSVSDTRIERVKLRILS